MKNNKKFSIKKILKNIFKVDFYNKNRKSEIILNKSFVGNSLLAKDGINSHFINKIK